MAQESFAKIQRFITATKIDVISAEVDTATGKKTATLVSERSICKILRRFNPERLEQFAEIGINKALHQIVGYQGSIDSQQMKFKAIVYDKLSMFDESDPRYQTSIDKFFDDSDPKFVEAVDKMTDMLVCTLYGELAEQLEKHLDACGNPLDFYNWKQAKSDAEYVAKKFLREGRQAYSENKIGAAEKLVDKLFMEAVDSLDINL